MGGLRSEASPTIVRVTADPVWTPTGVEAVAGSTVPLAAGGVAITAPAGVFHPLPGGLGAVSGPGGQEFTCVNFVGGTCFLEGAPFGALIGRVGADGTPFLIGDASSFVAPASGDLFLAVNDYIEFDDNQGGFTVRF